MLRLASEVSASNGFNFLGVTLASEHVNWCHIRIWPVTWQGRALLAQDWCRGSLQQSHFTTPAMDRDLLWSVLKGGRTPLSFLGSPAVVHQSRSLDYPWGTCQQFIHAVTIRHASAGGKDGGLAGEHQDRRWVSASCQTKKKGEESRLSSPRIFRHNCETAALPKDKSSRTHNEHRICIRNPYSCLERGMLPSGTNPLPNTQPQRLPHAWPRSSPSRGRILPPRRLSRSGAIPRRLLY